LALVVSGCSRAGTDDEAFKWTTELPAGAIVHFRNGVGDIQIKRASGSTIQVNGSRSWRKGRANDVRFVVESSGNDVYVCAMWRNSGNCGAKGYRGRNTGGFLAMFSLFHRTTDASADFEAEVPANVTVDASTASGEVDVEGLTSGVTATTVNGDIKAVNVAGRISLRSTNGDVRLEADQDAALQGVYLNTINGQVQAELPATVQGVFDLATTNGDVESDFPLTAMGKPSHGGHLKGQIGSSSEVFKLRSVNGSVSVTRQGNESGHDRQR